MRTEQEIIDRLKSVKKKLKISENDPSRYCISKETFITIENVLNWILEKDK